MRDVRSVRVGFGIALVLVGSNDGDDYPLAVRYALPYAEIVDDGSSVFVLGNPPTDPGELDPGPLAVAVTLDGHELRTAPRTPPGPAAAIARLAASGHGVPPGAFVLTGWLAELENVEPGFAAADLGPAGRVSFRIAEPGSPIADDRPPWGETIGPAEDQAPFSIGPFVDIYDPADGEREPWCLNDHCLAKGPDGLWHVFGITHPKPYNHALDPGTRLAHATAESLEQRGWHKEPFALTADPSRFDEHLLWAPHVVERDGTFHMFVCVGAASGNLFSIRRYESDDLWSWRRTDAPPVVVDGVEARDPMVLRDGDGWILYYTATEQPDGGRFVVAAVTSRDLVNWSSRRIVFTHPRAGAFGGPTESPFVVRRGPAYYLFVTDDEIVHVYGGRDPFSWSAEDHVFAYRGRACEIVRDETGTWFISHVGWELGGLALARLEWHDGHDDGPFPIPCALTRTATPDRLRNRFMKSVSHVSRERATIGDVAARAEVSPATVSRVLNGVENVQEEYRRRVLAAIEELDYGPTGWPATFGAAGSRCSAWWSRTSRTRTSPKRCGRSRTRRSTAATGCSLCNTDESPDKQREYLKLLAAERVAGVILSPSQADAAEVGAAAGPGHGGRGLRPRGDRPPS